MTCPSPFRGCDEAAELCGGALAAPNRADAPELWRQVRVQEVGHVITNYDASLGCRYATLPAHHRAKDEMITLVH